MSSKERTASYGQGTKKSQVGASIGAFMPVNMLTEDRLHFHMV